MVRRQILGDIGNLSAPPGSRDWAMAVRARLASSLHDAEFSAEEAKGWFDAMQTHQGWKQLVDAKDNRFLSYEAFCAAPLPFGLGYCLEDIDRIIRDRREKEAADRAKEAKPPGKTGRPEKGTHCVLLSKGSNDRRVAQIAKRRPDILERMKAGEFKSVRAAALEAGIVKPCFQCPIDPERAARLLEKHFTRAQFKRLLTFAFGGAWAEQV